ncbi:MAG: response regulator [Dinoroseobacter sp.]|nr:response regulator [Dinoroseobacter sp.]
MDDRPDPLAPHLRPTAARPLLGVTILLVEDSRYASEGMRLLCLRSGARLRRADCLKSARRHLKTYRPTVAIVDLGLPDGAGVDLIRELASSLPRLPVILGFSGALEGEEAALAAGADGFLAKPLTRLAEFQQAILMHLPDQRVQTGPRPVPDGEVTPDALALQDDLAHVRSLLTSEEDPVAQAYTAQFLHALAVSSSDAALAEAARSLSRDSAPATLTRVQMLIDARMEPRRAI